MKRSLVLSGFIVGLIASGLGGFFLVDKVIAPVPTKPQPVSQEEDWVKAHEIAFVNFQQDEERLIQVGIDSGYISLTRDQINQWGPIELSCGNNLYYFVDLSTGTMFCEMKIVKNAHSQEKSTISNGYSCSYLKTSTCEPAIRPLSQHKAINR